MKALTIDVTVLSSIAIAWIQVERPTPDKPGDPIAIGAAKNPNDLAEILDRHARSGKFKWFALIIDKSVVVPPMSAEKIITSISLFRQFVEGGKN
jgi:hypothetical protein